MLCFDIKMKNRINFLKFFVRKRLKNRYSIIKGKILKKYLLLLVLLGIIGISMFSLFIVKNNLTSITLESLFIENGEYNVFDNFSLLDGKNSEIPAHSGDEIICLKK